MHYELWSSESGNLLYDFDTEIDALTAVREVAAQNGAGSVDGLMLVAVGSKRRRATLATGRALEKRASAQAAK